jgi:myo-inositol-1(or 4)-monophosphatase
MSIDLQAALEVAVEAARQAGSTIMSFYGKPVEQAFKQNPSDIVTEVDRAAEAIIVERLGRAYPDHHMLGEEGGNMGAAVSDAEYSWYIDPIDGTTNFAYGLPLFAVSIALADRDMNPLVGVVYLPVTDEMYCAVKGGGATCNGEPIHVSRNDRLDRSLLVSGFHYTRYGKVDNNIPEWSEFVMKTRDLRRLGSIALELSYVAIGRLDGCWERGLNPWDYLAGALCVREAGGRVSDYEDRESPDIFRAGWIVASNGLIHQQIVDTLASVRSK